ncbi:MAG: alpha/beta hydrolase-fold protein [Mangrovibacterium sp.]
MVHIDSTYRTLSDREHRGVIGHSMGGIMSFYLAGKYPHLIGVAVNSKGSPEFFIGSPQNHSLYSVRYFFKNLLGVKLRFHNSTNCELNFLNTEVHHGALSEKELSYEYEVYQGEHALKPGEFTDAFHFVVTAFENPLPKPDRWHHADLYPDFDIWGYEVRSNLNEPGFIDMHGVTKGGLGITTKKWEPDGRPVPGVGITIKTAPVYEPNSSYTLLHYNQFNNQKTVSTVQSNPEGKISFAVGHEPHQIGIFKKNDPAEIVFLDYKVDRESAFLNHKKPCNLKLHLLNRGGSTGKGLKITLSTTTNGVTIANPTMAIDEILSCEESWLSSDFKVTASNEPPTDGSPFRVRFYLTITDDKQHTWRDEFDVPVYFDVPEFTNIGIDDGDSGIFGSGDGDNIAEPGESVLIYEITKESHRMRLYYDDPYVDKERLYDEIQPDKWGDGYTLSSIIHIAEDCPPGHRIKFLASYEIKDWKLIKRNVTWGTFSITIGGKEGE